MTDETTILTACAGPVTLDAMQTAIEDLGLEFRRPTYREVAEVISLIRSMRSFQDMDTISAPLLRTLYREKDWRKRNDPREDSNEESRG